MAVMPSPVPAYRNVSFKWALSCGDRPPTRFSRFIKALMPKAVPPMITADTPSLHKLV